MLVACCLRAEITRHTIRDVGVSKVNIYAAKQVMIHVIAVGVFVLGRDSDVFVQVKRAAT
jgi:hypothetical protein